ncbi:hypothetical protein [Sphingobacterium bovistauri]|uniref:Uncharacterized protein n=1 Tax=Sphingobacterium bovistauri TaxID=2781959 RepID=A0ABS7Z5T6_9SPHI|nr:hypothetical protein [Sphingobacterium bovistauri]MCA5004240.1 hypothetical protein [Sphingobacterium bovistauri]
MKSLLLSFIATVTSIGFVLAQDNNKNRNSTHFSIPKLNFTLPDSSMRMSPSNSLFDRIDVSIPIPNAYSGNNKVVYNMPIQKLSGAGLAPMPGTENLDKLERKLKVDSLLIKEKNRK